LEKKEEENTKEEKVKIKEVKEDKE